MEIEATDESSKGLIVHAELEAGKMSVSITLDGLVHRVWFAASGEDPGGEPDFLLPLALFPAMVRGSRLRLPGGVSPRLLAAVPKIQDIFTLWSAEHRSGKSRDAQRVPVEAEARGGRIDRASDVACFFSGGVDSFHTLLKHRDEVTHLIFVHGFDIDLADTAIRAQVSRMAREVAKELGKSLIEVETNLRSFSDRVVSWQEYHGAALSCVALLFQHRFRKVFIAASNTYAELVPWGSHPTLDPLWSTESTEIEHDGCEAPRLEKVDFISEHETALKWLRVCYTNPNNAYNCGRCGKCVRTKVFLRMTGALERCKTFSGDLDLEEVANMDLPSEASVFHVRHQLRTLERLGTEPELARALKKSLAASVVAEPKERAYLQRQLTLAHRKLVRTQANLEASKKRVQRLKKKGEGLTKNNRLLTARLSARRYRFVDAIVSMALRVSKIGKRVWRGSTARNR